MLLRYNKAGYLIISPQDDCNAVVDAMLSTGYNEEFCIGASLDPEFTARLMEAGFLVMSADVAGKNPDGEPEEEPFYVSLPKLHLERSVLFFENLHVKRSIRRFLSRYELLPDADFERIVGCCIEKHGSDWLTPPLVEAIKKIRVSSYDARPSSFALYRDNKLVAGEFGVICGKVYTSYSGFYDEPNAGTVQIILTAKHLQERGFLFFDMGMPLDYKNDLGAVNITPQEFVSLFRAGMEDNIKPT